MDYATYGNVIGAGLLAGSIFGVTIPTNTERKIRERPDIGYWKLLPFNGIFAIIVNRLISLSILALLMAFTAFYILKKTEAYPLDGNERIFLAASFAIGAFFLKLIRYCYWLQRRHSINKF